jgi:hypothetical protein
MPIPVKTRPKFKCQHCLAYRATLKAVERHEGFCWSNPDRMCELCGNTRKVFDPWHSRENNEPAYIDCKFCVKEDKDLTARLMEHRNDSKIQTPNQAIQGSIPERQIKPF